MVHTLTTYITSATTTGTNEAGAASEPSRRGKPYGADTEATASLHAATPVIDRVLPAIPATRPTTLTPGGQRSEARPVTGMGDPMGTTGMAGLTRGRAPATAVRPAPRVAVVTLETARVQARKLVPDVEAKALAVTPTAMQRPATEGVAPATTGVVPLRRLDEGGAPA